VLVFGNLNLISTHAEEITMKVITIGKRLVPAEQVAFVEVFDPASNTEFKPEKDFKGRVVLLNREIVLTEQTPQEFAAEHGLHLFAEDSVAVNRTIRFKIETFEPTESFKPSKPYRTRLKWNDLAGEEQSNTRATFASPRISASHFRGPRWSIGSSWSHSISKEVFQVNILGGPK
jgi:hypothetical protein